MTHNQIALCIHAVLIVAQLVPLWVAMTPDQRTGYAAMLGSLQMLLAQGQKQLDPDTGNLPAMPKPQDPPKAP